MKINNLSALVVVSVIISGLAGCSVSPDKTASPDAVDILDTSASVDDIVTELLSENMADFSTVINSGSMTKTTLHAGSVYYAASGKRCRRTEFENGSDYARYIACQDSTGLWYLTPALF